MATNAPLNNDSSMSSDRDQLSRRGAFSIAEWCRYRGICPATFYNHLQRGEMPAVVKIGRRTIITAEADAEWRLRMERQSVAGAPDGRASRVRQASFQQRLPDRHAARA